MISYVLHLCWEETCLSDVRLYKLLTFQPDGYLWALNRQVPRHSQQRAFGTIGLVSQLDVWSELGHDSRESKLSLRSGHLNKKWANHLSIRNMELHAMQFHGRKLETFEGAEKGCRLTSEGWVWQLQQNSKSFS